MTNEDDGLAWLKPVSQIALVVGLLAGYKAALAELARLFPDAEPFLPVAMWGLIAFLLLWFVASMWVVLSRWLTRRRRLIETRQENARKYLLGEMRWLYGWKPVRPVDPTRFLERSEC